MNINPDDRRSLYRQDPLLNRVLNRMPHHVVESFTELQLEAMRLAIAQPRKHFVDIRYSIPFIAQRFYLVVLAGPERRTRERLKHERREQPLWSVGNILFVGGGVFVLATMLYGLSSFVISMGETLQQDELRADHPTALPWIEREEDCKGEQRHWKDGLCFDEEHDRSFRR